MNKTQLAIIYSFDHGLNITSDGTVIGVRGKEKKTRVDTRGYIVVKIGYEGISRPICVHHLQAYKKYGMKMFDDKMQVRHLNGDKTDNSFNNISIGSAKENMLDRPPKERLIHSQLANKGRRFDNAQILEIRKLYKKPTSITEIAKLFKADRKTIREIVNFISYKDVLEVDEKLKSDIEDAKEQLSKKSLKDTLKRSAEKKKQIERASKVSVKRANIVFDFK